MGESAGEWASYMTARLSKPAAMVRQDLQRNLNAFIGNSLSMVELTEEVRAAAAEVKPAVSRPT